MATVQITAQYMANRELGEAEIEAGLRRIRSAIRGRPAYRLDGSSDAREVWKADGVTVVFSAQSAYGLNRRQLYAALRAWRLKRGAARLREAGAIAGRIIASHQRCWWELDYTDAQA